MKKILLALAAAAFVFAGCTKDLEQRVDTLEKGQANLQAQIDDIKEDISSIQTILDALQGNVYVSKVETTDEGYVITFTDGTTAVLKNGEKGDKGDTGAAGADGQDGATPVIGVAEVDGVLYWTVNGEFLTDADGNKVPAVGKDGANGADAPVPSFEIIDGHLYVTVDGITTDLGNVAGADGDAWFAGVEVSADGTYVTITLAQGGSICLPIYQGFNITFANLEVEFFEEGAELEVAYTIEGDATNTVVRAYACTGWTATVDKAASVINVTAGAGDGYVDVYAINNTTGEIKAKSLSFVKGEAVIVDETVVLSAPAVGGTVEIPVGKNLAYTVETDAEWLTYTETKAPVQETVVLTATENTSGATREAKVNFMVGGAVVATIPVAQKGYEPALLNVTWDESFGYSDSATDSNPNQSATKGKMTITLSDDAAKGTYLVTGMFGLPPYDGGEAQGFFYGSYYADIEGSTFTVYGANFTHEKHSKWGADIELTLSEDKTTLTGPAVTETDYTYSYWYFFNYTATVHVEAAPSGNYDWLIGTYTESFDDSSYWGYPSKGELVIEASDDANYDVKVTLFAGTSCATTTYGTVSEDGTTLTLAACNSNYLGKVAESVLTINGNQLAGTINLSYPVITDYVATKKVDPVEALIGTYTETFDDSSFWGYPSAGELTIEASDNADYDVKATLFAGTKCALVSYGTVSEDGTTLTLAGGSNNNLGPMTACTLTFDGTTLSGTLGFTYPTIDYVAVKQ